MDSSPHTTTVDFQIVKENLVDVNSEIINKTACKDDPWIRQRRQRLSTQKYWRKTESFADTAPINLKIFNENWVAAISEIITEIACRADA